MSSGNKWKRMQLLLVMIDRERRAIELLLLMILGKIISKFYRELREYINQIKIA